MKIKMLQTVNGKVNGVKMGPYTEGVEYDIDDERAQLFIGSAMAEEVVVAHIDSISQLQGLLSEVGATLDRGEVKAALAEGHKELVATARAVLPRNRLLGL